MVTALCTLILVLVALFSTHSNDYAKGVAEAKAQIRSGHITLYAYGHPGDGPDYDATTGLPLESIARCMPVDSIVERLRGHNDYIERWIATGNTPPNSLRNYNDVIDRPFATIPTSLFASLSNTEAIKLGGIQIAYSRMPLRSDDIEEYKFLVTTSDGAWSDTVFNARNFLIALLADGRILAMTYVFDGKDSFPGWLDKRIQLFDTATGISLNYSKREIPQASAPIR